MKTTVNKTILRISLLAALLALGGCASLPDDGAKAQTKRFEDLHTLRYIEIFVVGGNAITKNLRANVYNTTFRSDYDPSFLSSLPITSGQMSS